MAKRKLELDVSDIDTTKVCRGATVHGIVTELSPVKISKNDNRYHYFHGQISDGKKSLRLVSFDPKLKNLMEKLKEDKKEIAIENCSIQESKRG